MRSTCEQTVKVALLPAIERNRMKEGVEIRVNVLYERRGEALENRIDYKLMARPNLTVQGHNDSTP